MQISIKDIFNLYISLTSNNEPEMRLPLCDIDLNTDSLNQIAIENIHKVICEMNSHEITKRKPDPTALLLNTLDAIQTPADIDLFEQIKQAEKFRGNLIGKLNHHTVTLAKNIIESNERGLDAIVLDNNDEPIAIARVVNKYSSLNMSSIEKTHKTFVELTTNPESAYFGCQAILVEKIPKHDGTAMRFYPGVQEQDKPNSDRILRMGLQQFMTNYGHDKYAYVKSLVIIARSLFEIGKLPADYDMRIIFSSLTKSIAKQP